MTDITILKNKKLTIKVKFESQTPLATGFNVNKYAELEIKRESGEVEEYEQDADGVAKNKKNPFPLSKNLTEVALEEKRSFYKELLRKYGEIENLVVLSGAGSSVGIGVDNKGLTMAGLWDQLAKEQTSSLTTLIKESKYHQVNEHNVIVNPESLVKDLEALLSQAGIANLVLKNAELAAAIKVAREFIAEKCTIVLPDDSPHLHLLNKILLRPQKFPRVKIFTLNYDTLFEQAAAKEKFTVIDGFTFSAPRLFNGKYFDYDIVETRHNRQDKTDSNIAKLFYLFKMHGSLNWKRNKAEIEQSEHPIEIDDRVMIFPQDSKYEHSYEQPYFEMMARFQQTLRTENTLLITVGFSFIDKHISSVIIESLKQNPSLNLVAFTFPEIVDGGENAKTYQKELHRIAEIQSRVTLVAETFENFAKEYPENIAHKRFDLLEDLNDNLKKIVPNDSK
jgi:NAD-dependent SIR2 family protein deacetylase